ncbi:plasma-membrane proton-efflux P-type ATPase [Novosphingobium sp. Fuku2-ISO-50]|uniref:plasma-membrane proton-efflux P-type ATPase n=1 Tax=Novosphingobium sp. Fuku2-ISO-50 TaxID=1739114 RepID=UPI00076BEF62|nr:plasma-membrane proton-efflux P-type ATPase [Novosphingobium sp. Fuku2-ISO-50]KUR76726.1 pirin [Novosphingobium sp. Fuku2-ISO-50]
MHTADPKGLGIAGLTATEARRRLAQFGPNTIPEPGEHAVFQLLRKVWGPIPWMLEATIALQLALGKHLEAGVIAGLLVVNAGISFIEEGRASRALDLLRQRLSARARVLRDGAWRVIDADQLVPGDVVHLRMGDLAPADIRIAEGSVLLDQSALTGEAAGIEVGPGANAYAAAIVRRGEATGEVTATGARSYFGKTAELVRDAHPTSHLQTTVLRIVRVLMAIDAALIAVLLGWSLWTHLPLTEVLPFALILLVASVPVALPATFTLATALGAAELARSGVLLSRLTAIEEAAGMDVLCTDKTGTLTQNRLTLAKARPIAAITGSELLWLAALASDPATQDPIDIAILDGTRAEMATHKVIDKLGFEPFDPATRYSMGHYRAGANELWVAKGAPTAICGLIAQAPDISALSEEMAAGGNRVLAVASGPDRGSLTLAGLIALEDPPRSDSAQLVAGLQALGVRVIMVTGDNAATARSVAARVGIAGPDAGAAMLEQMDGAQALDFGVYARVFPEHKIRLVRLLQQAGHVVGMTGDGVNDAPALRQADVGIAVASATDVARAAAGVVLTQPGLVDALTAVRTSRQIYQRMLTYTINKIMKTLEIAVFLSLGVILTHQFVITPLLIVLLLFTNDFATMAIATDNVGYSARPDRWDVRMLMLTGGMLAGLVLILSFAVFFYGRTILGLPLPQLQTLVFVMLVATGQGNVYLVRERGHFWRSRPSRWLIAASVLDLLLVAFMATQGMFMAAITPVLLIALLALVGVWLFLLDQIKVLIFRGMDLVA